MQFFATHTVRNTFLCFFIFYAPEKFVSANNHMMKKMND